MKLFIWANPYHVNYGSSMYFAVADNVEDARALATAATAYAYTEFLRNGEGRAPVGPDSLGVPTRVLDLPCAEWHEWSE